MQVICGECGAVHVCDRDVPDVCSNCRKRRWFSMDEPKIAWELSEQDKRFMRRRLGVGVDREDG